MAIPPIGGVTAGVGPLASSDPAFQIPSIGSDASVAPTSSPGGSDFGSMLMDQIGSLNAAQNQASTQSQALATGQATDVTSVVADVEKASLEMQLATQVRNKAVDSYNELFRMQI
jgi:flagellar hook-basal body complex protein FliE